MAFRRDVCPVLFVFGPLFDPFREKCLLAGGQRFSAGSVLVDVRRRHHVIRIIAVNPFHKLAFVRFPGDDCRPVVSFPVRRRTGTNVQPELGFQGLLVWPVAGRALVRDNRTDVPVVLDLLREVAGIPVYTPVVQLNDQKSAYQQGNNERRDGQKTKTERPSEFSSTFRHARTTPDRARSSVRIPRDHT